MLTYNKIEAYIESLLDLQKLTTHKSVFCYLELDEWNLIEKHFDTYIYQSPCENYILRVEKDFSEYGHHLFVKHAKNFQNNPYMPKIFWYSENECMNFTFMEYLQPLNKKHSAFKDFEDSFPLGAKEVDPVLTNDNHLEEALNAISELVTSQKLESDISLKNVMQRPNGQLVLIDPVV